MFRTSSNVRNNKKVRFPANVLIRKFKEEIVLNRTASKIRRGVTFEILFNNEKVLTQFEEKRVDLRSAVRLCMPE